MSRRRSGGSTKSTYALRNLSMTVSETIYCFPNLSIHYKPVRNAFDSESPRGHPGFTRQLFDQAEESTRGFDSPFDIQRCAVGKLVGRQQLRRCPAAPKAQAHKEGGRLGKFQPTGGLPDWCCCCSRQAGSPRGRATSAYQSAIHVQVLTVSIRAPLLLCVDHRIRTPSTLQ